MGTLEDSLYEKVFLCLRWGVISAVVGTWKTLIWVAAVLATIYGIGYAENIFWGVNHLAGVFWFIVLQALLPSLAAVCAVGFYTGAVKGWKFCIDEKETFEQEVRRRLLEIEMNLGIQKRNW